MTQLTSILEHLWHETWQIFEHKQKLLLSPRSGSFAAETHLGLVASAESLKFPTRGSHDTLRLPHTCTSSSWCMLHLPCHRCNPSLHPVEDALSPGNTEVAVKRDQLLNGPTLPMLWFQYPELCEFQLPGRPRRTKEGDLKVRTQRVVEGGQTRTG